MKTYHLYIGANNETNKVEHNVIITTVLRRFSSFTLHDTMGYYEGKPEPSCVVTLILEDSLEAQSDVYRLGYELADALKQRAILVEEFLITVSAIRGELLPMPEPESVPELGQEKPESESGSESESPKSEPKKTIIH